jgi:hypothetical protein
MKRRASGTNSAQPKRPRDGDDAGVSHALKTALSVDPGLPDQSAQTPSTTDCTSSTGAAKERENRTVSATKSTPLFRVRGISLDETKQGVLKTCQNSLVGRMDVVEVLTLAVDIQGREQVAVVRLSSVSPSSSSRFKLECFPATWELDENFYGMTVLHCPPQDVHTVEYDLLTSL